jgi:hypothetical protein
MTANKGVQLKSDILYEHHKAAQDIRTELLTLTLERWQERLQAASEKLNSSSHTWKDSFRRDSAPSGEIAALDVDAINKACQEAIALRERWINCQPARRV